MTLKQSRYLFRLGICLLLLALFVPQWWFWVPAAVAGTVTMFLESVAKQRRLAHYWRQEEDRIKARVNDE